MKGSIKALIVLAVLGWIGFCVYFVMYGNPAARACSKLESLCGAKMGRNAIAPGSVSGGRRAQCEQGMEKLEQVAGKKGMDKAVACIGESTSCPGAMGCLIGATMGGAAGQFLKGVKRALGDK